MVHKILKYPCCIIDNLKCYCLLLIIKMFYNNNFYWQKFVNRRRIQSRKHRKNQLKLLYTFGTLCLNIIAKAIHNKYKQHNTEDSPQIVKWPPNLYLLQCFVYDSLFCCIHLIVLIFATSYQEIIKMDKFFVSGRIKKRKENKYGCRKCLSFSIFDVAECCQCLKLP